MAQGFPVLQGMCLAYEREWYSWKIRCVSSVLVKVGHPWPQERVLAALTTGRSLRTVNGPVQSAWPHAASPYMHCPLPEFRQVNRTLTSGWGG